MTVKTFDPETEALVWEALFRRVFPEGIPPSDPSRAVTDFSGGYPTGHRNPSDDNTYLLELHWDHDFTPEQEEEWERIMAWARRKGGHYEPDKERDQFTKLTNLKGKKGKGRNPQEMAQAIDDLTELVQMLMGDTNG